MNYKEDDFLKRLLVMFKIEAEERVRVMSSALVELENAEVDLRAAILETVFREAHSLKGAARAVNAREIEMISKALEGVFAALKRNDIQATAATFDALHQGVDAIQKLLLSGLTEENQLALLIAALGRIEKGPIENKPMLPEPVNDTLIKSLEPIERLLELPETSPQTPNRQERRLLEYSGVQGRAVPEASDDSISASLSPLRDRNLVPETIRISTAKLDALLLQAEEMLSAKLAANQRVADSRDVLGHIVVLRREISRLQSEIQGFRQGIENQGIQLQDDEISSVSQITELAEWCQNMVRSIELEARSIQKSEETDRRVLGGMIDNLLGDMKQILMLPFVSLLEVFPKMVRDLSRDQSKEVDLILHGTEIEIDKRILEQLKDPMIHLIRNSIDHGIELPERRVQVGKSRRGTIVVSITQIDGNKVEIVVADDGRGIDIERVKTAVRNQGIILPNELDLFSENEIMQMVFQSDVSTSPIITDLSGRGLGLAIVKEKVSRLGGLIQLSSDQSRGTTFRMILPVTMATFRGILIKSADQYFVIPTSDIDRVVRIREDEIVPVEGKDTITLDERTVPLVRLAHILELPESARKVRPTKYTTVVVLGGEDRKVGFVVERVMNEQEVLVKGMGRQLIRVRNVAGATVLGSGRVVPILNASDLMKSATRSGYSAGYLGSAASIPEQNRKKTILVAEDSITSRMLLKNILESAGFNVKTAVDGLDAWNLMESEAVDLVTSDVEMPRMTGFDLTGRIRNDERFKDIPVVLVTGLAKSEDQVRGIEVGADAYIVKSSFDQSNLLDVIQRLI
ncbi:MAG: response regulator [Solirubrobacterales bacterium]